ncbi:hypothetical protein LCGC14_1391600 [marine sediment metagenome]|uniref:Uncharacterized protein n=1 Tax=marine sediment metagenome TaxID=412755 RepID=A0A0F9MFG1_9ZZZZ
MSKDGNKLVAFWQYTELTTRNVPYDYRTMSEENTMLPYVAPEDIAKAQCLTNWRCLPDPIVRGN